MRYRPAAALTIEHLMARTYRDVDKHCEIVTPTSDIPPNTFLCSSRLARGRSVCRAVAHYRRRHVPCSASPRCSVTNVHDAREAFVGAVDASGYFRLRASYRVDCIRMARVASDHGHRGSDACSSRRQFTKHYRLRNVFTHIN